MLVHEMVFVFLLFTSSYISMVVKHNLILLIVCFGSMARILERYERYSFAERELVLSSQDSEVCEIKSYLNVASWFCGAYDAIKK